MIFVDPDVAAVSNSSFTPSVPTHVSSGNNSTLDTICLYYQNVRGLRTKTNEFYTACCDCDYDVIAITETGLIPSIHDSEIFSSDEYLVYRCDRGPLNSESNFGGGVLIAVRSNRMSEMVMVDGIEMVEMVVVRCAFGKSITYILLLIHTLW